MMIAGYWNDAGLGRRAGRELVGLAKIRMEGGEFKEVRPDEDPRQLAASCLMLFYTICLPSLIVASLLTPLFAHCPALRFAHHRPPSCFTPSLGAT